jgi:hypothetical protein
MTRLFPFLAVVCAAFAVPAFAAPVPKHLMKDPPLSFPTAVGTKWVYEGDFGEHTQVISKVEDKGGAKIVTTEHVLADGKRSPHMVQSISEQGVYLIAERGVAYEEPWLMVKLPHRDGQTWSIKAKRGTLDFDSTVTAGPFENVRVPAGEFTAARVEVEFWTVVGPRSKVTYWFAHGVGLIRMDDSTKLKSFKPGKN